jgi:hypothetical protein
MVREKLWSSRGNDTRDAIETANRSASSLNSGKVDKSGHNSVKQKSCQPAAQKAPRPEPIEDRGVPDLALGSVPACV